MTLKNRKKNEIIRSKIIPGISGPWLRYEKPKGSPLGFVM